MTSERNDFRLCFLTDRHAILSLNIPHADTGSAPAEIAAAMQSIIASDAVQSARGRPLFRHNAAIITTKSQEFEL